MRPSLPIKEFDDIERSILTLTAILQRMGRPENVVLPPSQIPAFLRHTCGDENDANAKDTIAVTGGLTAEGLKILVKFFQSPAGIVLSFK